MAGVRDPAFWKRFSVAVHLDEEQGTSKTDLKHSDSWLARQNKKRSRRTKICWAFWGGFFVLGAAVTIIIILLIQSGVFNNLRLGGAGAGSQ